MLTSFYRKVLKATVIREPIIPTDSQYPHLPYIQSRVSYYSGYSTFSSLQWTTIEGYFLESQRKNAGTPILRGDVDGMRTHTAVSRFNRTSDSPYATAGSRPRGLRMHQDEVQVN